MKVIGMTTLVMTTVGDLMIIHELTHQIATVGEKRTIDTMNVAGNVAYIRHDRHVTNVFRNVVIITKCLKLL